MMAIDVSGSMAAADVSPYRLRAAQDAALTFAQEVPRQYQVGLVSFNGRANLLVAPTTDRDALDRAIQSLVPDGATAVGEAVVASLDAIRASQGLAAEGRAARGRAHRRAVGRRDDRRPPAVGRGRAGGAGRGAGVHRVAGDGRRHPAQRPARAARRRGDAGARRERPAVTPTRAATPRR